MLEDLKPAHKDRRSYCRVGEVRESLSVEDQALLDKYLADVDSWSANGLSEALTKKGLKVSVHPIIRHRKGICAC